ncbi:MAG: tRNA lysidine(34) synthetase TilS [candidate division WOR-3 bacterium]|nr:tRNA lysidine(34) synthetase TilS [candidate division WOR-3 bacterium]
MKSISILENVKETIERHKMFEGVKKALIGFSSGPDSVCLLDVLKTIYQNDIDFFLIYVNHGLRDRKVLEYEERLTAYYAHKYNCGFKIVKISIPKTKKGIEAEARERRYDVFIDYAQKISAQRVVLGHNLDDLVETFFMNLIRGSGNVGFQSIPPVRLPFVRPLINVKKIDILRYLKEKGLKFSRDMTNLDIDIRRNFIRQKIIPRLIELNPRIYETIKREIEILHDDEEFMQIAVNRAYNRCREKKKDGITLDLNRLMHYNKAIRNRVIMKAIVELKGNLTGIESKHIEGIWSLRSKLSGRILCLPEGLYAQKVYDKIFLGWKDSAIKKRTEIELEIGKEIRFGDLKVRSEIIEHFDLKKKKENCEVFDLSQVVPPLILRNRKRGDVVVIKGGKKRLKEILIEKKIASLERDDVGLLCDREGILWVMGVYRAYRAFIQKNTKKILKVEFEHIN